MILVQDGQALQVLQVLQDARMPAGIAACLLACLFVGLRRDGAGRGCARLHVNHEWRECACLIIAAAPNHMGHLSMPPAAATEAAVPLTLATCILFRCCCCRFQAHGAPRARCGRLCWPGAGPPCRTRCRPYWLRWVEEQRAVAGFLHRNSSLTYLLLLPTARTNKN